MQTQPMEKKFCTTREAAEMLGVSIGSVQHWVERGLLEAWKTDGGHRRVLRESVQNLLGQKQVAALAASAPERIAASAKPKAATTGLRRLRVLAIDDDVVMLHLYQAKMQDWVMAPEVAVSESAVAGLVRIGLTCPDLLIVDLQMPGMDGFELLRILADMPEIKDTTIVVATAMDTEQVAQRGTLPAGIEVVRKPVPFDRLLEIAQGIAGRKHLERRAG